MISENTSTVERLDNYLTRQGWPQEATFDRGEFMLLRQLFPAHSPLHCPFCEEHGNRDDHFWHNGVLIRIA